jgi:hypothetical protein
MNSKNFFLYLHLKKKPIRVANNTKMNSIGYAELKIEIGSIGTTTKLWIL